MKHKISLLLIILSLGAGVKSFAQSSELLEYTEEGKSESTDSVQARQDAIQDAIDKVSGRLIREFIGDSKYDRQLTSIRSKVIAESEKYIVYIKTSTPRKEGTLTLMNVTMKVSTKSLQDLLQQSGFLSATDGPAILLPAVAYYDLVNHKSLKWWSDDPKTLYPFLKNQDRLFVDQLKKDFSSIGFHILDPQTWSYREQVPSTLQMESLRTQDYLALGENFKSQLVLRGDFKIEEGKNPESYRVVTRFTVLHTGNGRVIADSVKTSETDPGSFNLVVPKKLAELNSELSQDLAQQVREAWSRGTIGASLIRLSVYGNYDYKDLEVLKNTIIRDARAVKTLRERLFLKNTAEFEVDVAGGAEALSQSLARIKVPGYTFKVDSVDSQRVEVIFKR